MTKEELNKGRRHGDVDSHHHLALWSGFTAFFTNIAAVNVIVLVGRHNDEVSKILGALMTALLVALATYARQRRDDERDRRERMKLEG